MIAVQRAGAVVAVVFALTSHTEAQTADLVEIGGRLGLTAITNAGPSGSVIPPSVLPEDRRNAALERALTQYSSLRNAHTGAQEGGESLAATADALAVGSAVVGNVPGVLIGLSLRAAIDAGNRELDRQMEQRSRDYLVAINSQLVTASGAENFRALVGQPDRLVSTVLEAEDLLGDIRRRGLESGDTALATTVANALAEVADEAAIAAVEQGAFNAGNIATLEADLTELTVNTRDAFSYAGAQLHEHEARLSGLEADVDALQGAVSTLDDQMQRLGRNQDLIADFVLARMTPAERLRALEGGSLNDRIVCPTERPDCNRDEVRGALIERYRAEAELQATFNGVAEVLGTAGTVAGILQDVGLDLPPEVSQSLTIGNAVFGAVTNFASGNILGGIAAITGWFGSSKDAAAERHAEMMNYLQNNFAHINEQLDGLRQGQQRILEGLVTVSEQIDAMHRNMDARFDALDYRVFVIAHNVQSLLWEGWAACNSVYRYAGSPNPSVGAESLFDPRSHVFASLDARFQVVRWQGQNVRDCRNTMVRSADAVSSVAAWDRHGWFLDLERSSFVQSPEQHARLRAALAQDDVPDFRALADRHQSAVVSPALMILLEWAERNGIAPASLLYALATGPDDMSDVRDLLELLLPADGEESWRYGCIAADERRRLLAEILCGIGSTHSETLALRHLSAALNTSFMPEATNFALIMAQLLDLYYGTPDDFAMSRVSVSQMTNESLGSGLIRQYLAIGNLAIAHDQRIHGGLTALVVADDLVARRATESHRLLLAANPYMAENTATALLHRWRETWAMEEAISSGPSFENRYAQALLHARSGASSSIYSLEALFGRNRGFVLEENRPVIEIALPGGDVRLPMPGPLQLSKGRFMMPSTYPDLVAARDALLDRFIDYELGSDPDIATLSALLR